MELKREQIIKALECCNTIGGCKFCPYSFEGKPTTNGECGEKMSLDALSLIKELTEESRIANGEAYAYKLHCNRLEQQVKTLSELLDEAYDTIADGDDR